MKQKCILILLIIQLFSTLLFSQERKNQVQISKPLLRIFPVLQIQECEWAIRMDVCWKCLRIEKRYAQKIYFYEDGVYREHGCYTEKEGFSVLQ